jgi:signal transduction histidine kinase
LLDSTNKYLSSDELISNIYKDSCIYIATKNNDYKVLGELYKMLGVHSYLNGSYEDAYKNYTLSITSYEKGKDSLGMATTYLELGNFYKKKNQLNEAKKYYEEALVIAIKKKDKILEANSYNNLGLYYESFKSMDTAKRFYEKSLETYQSVNNDIGISYSLEYLAGVYKDKKDFTNALDYLKKSLAYRQKANNKNAQSISLVNIGELYFAQNKYSEAINYFNQTIELAKEIKYKDLLAYAYQMQSQSYKNINDYKNAYLFQDSAIMLQDELSEEINSKQLKEIQTKYETENKEKLLQIKDLELTKKNLKLTRNNIIIFSLIILFLLSAITFYLLYNRYKLKQKTILNEQLLKEQDAKAKAVIEAEENERQRIGKDLHDGIGQLLSAVKLNFSGIESNLIKNNSNDIYLLSNAKKLVDESVTEVRNISHNMMPSVLLQYGLVVAIEDFTSKINNSNLLKINFSHTGFENKKLISSLEIVLYRVVQELVNNAIKHAQASKMDIQLLLFDQELTLMLEDNGKGFDYEQTVLSKNGIGLKNIISRINYINGMINFDSSKGNGTTITIEKKLSNTDYETN